MPGVMMASPRGAVSTLPSDVVPTREALHEPGNANATNVVADGTAPVKRMTGCVSTPIVLGVMATMVSAAATRALPARRRTHATVMVALRPMVRARGQLLEPNGV